MPRIVIVNFLFIIPFLCFGQGQISRQSPDNVMKHRVNKTHASNDKRLIAQAKDLYKNGDYEKAWDKLMNVSNSDTDTTYLMLLGDIGYIYKSNYANGGRWCYEKAAKLGCKSGEIKSRSFFRSRTIATGSGTSTPGDSLNMLGFNSNGPERINYFKEGAKCGSAIAMVNLGRAYENGRDTELDFEKAAQLFLQSYEINKNTDAAEHLAWLYSLGLGVPKDLNETFNLYNRSQHILRNKVNLAICFENGIGTDQDLLKSLELYVNVLCNTTDNEDWISYAAKRYIFLTQDEAIDFPLYKEKEHIGNLYYNLYGYISRKIINNSTIKPSEKDRYKLIADQYLNLALSNGVTEGNAMNNLGNIFKERKEYDKALALYFQAANDFKNKYAYWNIGKCYENGLGTTKDLQEAKIWYERAKSAGNYSADDDLKRLAKKGI